MKELKKLITAKVLTHGEKKIGIHWIGGWVDPRTCLDVVEKKNIVPLPGIQPRLSSPSRRQGHWIAKNTRCILASRLDRFTPGITAPGLISSLRNSWDLSESK
jgi:hypothetical protein